MTVRIAIGPARDRFERGEALWRIAADYKTTRQTLAVHLRAAGVDTARTPRERIAARRQSRFVDGLLKMQRGGRP